MDKYARGGAKKLFSLAKTKIRLAEETGTKKTRPDPLPLVKLLSGKNVGTVSEAKEHMASLRAETDFSDLQKTAEAVFQALDIVEGVKYGFEPPELCVLAGEEELRGLEEKAAAAGEKLNLLLFMEDAPAGFNTSIGEHPIPGALHLGRVPSAAAYFLAYAFQSDYLSDGMRLKNIRSFLGRKTLIADAIHAAMGAFGAELR